MDLSAGLTEEADDEYMHTVLDKDSYLKFEGEETAEEDVKKAETPG